MAVKKKYDRNVLGRGLDQIDNGRGLDALIDTHSEVKTEGSSKSANWESFSPLPCAKWRVRNTRLLPVSAVGVPHNWQD